MTHSIEYNSFSGGAVDRLCDLFNGSTRRALRAVAPERPKAAVK